MKRLFINPPQGSLGQTIDALREAGFQVEIVGWGYPPIFVTADEDQIEGIKEIALEVNPETTFQSWRSDLMTPLEISTFLAKIYGERNEE